MDVKATVLAGGRQIILNGLGVGPDGLAKSATLSGGEQDVYGSATGTTVNSGGVQIVEDGGVARATIVNPGGTETVSAGGSDVAATINGGLQTDYGSASGATVSGGEQDVYGAATSATVDSGGLQRVESGGVASGTTIDGGEEYVTSGGLASTLTFGAQGALALERPSGFAGAISGLQTGDIIDFVSTTVTSAAISDSTLTVVAGGQTYDYALSGQEAGIKPSIRSDGQGGTELTFAVADSFGGAAALLGPNLAFGASGVGYGLTAAPDPTPPLHQSWLTTPKG